MAKKEITLKHLKEKATSKNLMTNRFSHEIILFQFFSLLWLLPHKSHNLMLWSSLDRWWNFICTFHPTQFKFYSIALVPP
jgi:hypothetical protein